MPDPMMVVTIPGLAKGKGRAKFSRASGRAYTPAATVNAETWVRSCCIEQVGSPCWGGPVAVKIGISVPIPKSWSKKKQADALSGAIMPTGKPDIDNSVKLLFDACNSILWRDDAQVVELAVRKSYALTPLTILMVEAV